MGIEIEFPIEAQDDAQEVIIFLRFLTMHSSYNL